MTIDIATVRDVQVRLVAKKSSTFRTDNSTNETEEKIKRLAADEATSEVARELLVLRNTLIQEIINDLEDLIQEAKEESI